MATERELNILIKAKDMASKVLDKYSSQFDMIGKSLLAVGAAGVTGIGAAIKVAATFEEGMSRVGALSGTTDDELKVLTKTAKNLGATTSFSAKQASDGMSALAMAGFDVNEIVAAMPGLLDTAAAGKMDLGRTADIVSNVLSGFQISADETGRVADVMTKAFTSSNTDLGMLGETFKYVGPIASSAGFSLEEMAAAAGLLGNAGIQGGQAGTTLRSAIMRLQAPVGEAAELMQEYGIQVRDAEGNMKSMPDILAAFEDGMSNLTQEQKDNLISTVIGMEAASGFQALLNEGSDTLRDYTKELENAGGTAKEIADKQLDNLNGAITIFKSALEGAAIEIGTVFIPYIRMAVEFLTGLLSAFNGLDPSLQRKIALFAAGASALALLTGGILVLIPMLPMLAGLFGALLGPVGLVIAIVVGLAAAILTNFGGIRDFIKGWVDAIITTFQYLTGGMDDVVAKGSMMGVDLEAVLGPKAFALVQMFTTMKDLIVQRFTELQAIVVPIVTLFGEFLINFWNTHGTQIVTTVQTAFALVQEIISTVLTFVAQFITTHGAQILSIISNTFNSVWSVISVVMEVVLSLLQQAWSGIKSLIDTHGASIQASVMKFFTAAQQTIQTVAEIITSIIEWAFPYVQQIIQVVLNDVIPWAIQMFNKIASFISDVMPKIVQVIKYAWENVIRPVISGVMNGLVPLIKSAWSMISGVISGALDFVMGIVKTVLSILTGDWKGAWNGIKQATSGVLNMIKSVVKGGLDFVVKLFKGLLSTLGGLGGSFLKVGSDLMKGLLNGIKNMAKGIATAAVNAVKGAVNAAKSFLGIKSPSRLMMEIGAFTSEGLADGILGAMHLARKASEKMARATAKPVDDMDLDPSGLTGGPGGGSGGAGAFAGGSGSGETTVIINFQEGSVVLPGVKNGMEFIKQLQGFALKQAFKTQ